MIKTPSWAASRPVRWSKIRRNSTGTLPEFCSKSARNNPSLEFFPAPSSNQAGNIVGDELVSSHRDKGSLGEDQSSFGIGSLKKILEAFLGKQRFPRIWLGPHKGVIIRTERCAGGIRTPGAGPANEADQYDKKEGRFRGLNFKCSNFWIRLVPSGFATQIILAWRWPGVCALVPLRSPELVPGSRDSPAWRYSWPVACPVLPVSS
jgi:hypothetical protein